MTESSSSPVVVAVGPGTMDAALAFAAEEATSTGSPLQLVHVVHLQPLGPEAAVLSERDQERVGRQALNAALASARELVPTGTPVTAELCLGPVVPTMTDVASDARMIVLQRRDLSSVRRVVTRSVSSGVAARARVPVVSVPEHWSPEHPRERGPTVTVGIDAAERSLEVLRAAAAATNRRGAVLHVVHAWRFPAAYDDLALSASEAEECDRLAIAEIQHALDDFGTDTLDVPYRLDVRRGPVADALLEAGEMSDLLVVGRHDSRVPLGSHLGPIARAVLHEADCPVLLVDPRGAPGQQRLEEAATEATARRA